MIDVQKEISIHVVVGELEGLAMANVHCHGLEKFGHPNFAVWAPSIYINSAGELLNSLADAVINKDEVFGGDENCDWMEWGKFTLNSDKDESGQPILRIVPIAPQCGECGR